MNAHRPGSLYEVKEFRIVEKELADQELGSGLDFFLKLGQVDLGALGLGVHFGMTAPPDREAPALGDERGEFVCVVESAVRVAKIRGIPGRVAAQGQHVLDASCGQIVEDLGDFRAFRAQAGKVGHGGQAEFSLDSDHEVDGLVPGRPPGPHGDRNEARGEFSEVADGLEKTLVTAFGLWGKELKGHDRVAITIEIDDIHGFILPVRPGRRPAAVRELRGLNAKRSSFNSCRFWLQARLPSTTSWSSKICSKTTFYPIKSIG